MSKTIVFVDDEKHLLSGLKRGLRSFRNDWSMIFVASGKEALEVLDERNVDVVVSDMRMPGMDGVTLLRKTKERDPSIIRIVLSGYSELEKSVEVAGIAHQFLAKPCEINALLGVIKCAFQMKELLGDARIQKVVGSLEKLPNRATTYHELVEVLSDPECTVSDIERPIAREPALTAKILQLVNSSFFGVRRDIVSIKRAISLLGVSTLKSLVLLFAVPDGEDTANATLLRDLQRHSLITSRIAKTMFADEARAEEASIAGMLHDLGTLILAGKFNKEYPEILAMARHEKKPLCVKEREVLGASHAEVGAYLLGIWGLPPHVVQSAAYHHEPQNAIEPAFGVIGATYVADSLAHESMAALGYDDPSLTEKLNDEYIVAAGVSEKLLLWRENALRIVDSCLSHGRGWIDE